MGNLPKGVKERPDDSIERPDGAERGAEPHASQCSQRQCHERPTQTPQYAAREVAARHALYEGGAYRWQGNEGVSVGSLSRHRIPAQGDQPW